MKFRVPEIVLGALLAVAVFAVGMLFSSRHPQQVVGVNAKQGATESVQSHGDSQHASSGEVKAVSQPQQADRHSDTHEIYGVKPGEFLLFLATVGLWAATMLLVRDARKTAERQLRAYVLLNRAKIRDMAEGKIPVATVKIKNFGQTPAYALSHWAELKYAAFPRTEDADMSDPEGMPIHHIGPGSSMRITAPLEHELTKEQFEAVQSGSAALYLTGRTSYLDAFGESRFTEYIVFSGGPLGLSPRMGGYNQGHKTS
jgi:hypothetical protein